MAAHQLSPVKKQNFAFMTCILKVNTRSTRWQKTLMRVLNNIDGVTNFRMNEDGKVEVSGTVDPMLLLTMLGKAGKQAEVCWFQFGECSSNLYMPTPPPQTSTNYYCNHVQNGFYDGSYYGYGDYRYLQCEGYGPKRPCHHLCSPSSHHEHVPSASNGNALHVETPSKATTTRTPMSDKCISCCSLM